MFDYPGIFLFKSLSNRAVFPSKQTLHIGGFETEESMLGEHDSTALEESSLKNIEKLHFASINNGHSSLGFLNARSRTNINVNGLLKVTPVVFSKRVIGTFHEMLTLGSDLNDDSQKLNYLCHPDLLRQSLLDGTAKHRQFELHGRLFSFNVLEINILFYLLNGYDIKEISSELKISEYRIIHYKQSIFNQLNISSQSELMHLLFSKQLLQGYGYNLNTSFNKQFMSMIIKKMISIKL